MKKMFSILLVLLAVSGISLISLTCSLKKETIKIGAIISLTGATSHLVDVRDGMTLAVDEVNKWGGVNGRELELTVEDSKSDPETAVKEFKKMESRLHPLLYVSVTSNVSMALAPLAEEDEVPLIGLVVTTPRLTQDNDWTFRYYSSAEDELKTTLFIIKTLKVKKLGILYQNDELGQTYKPLEDRFEKEGGIVESRNFDVDNPEFENKIPSLMDTDAIVIVAFVKPGKAAIEEIKKSGYSGFIIGQAGLAALAETDPMVDGMYIASSVLYKPNFYFAQELKRKYESQYNKRLTHQAAIGYDIVKLLAGLLEGHEISRESARDLLAGGFTYPGVFGDITVKPGGHDIEYPLYPAKVVGGTIEYMR